MLENNFACFFVCFNVSILSDSLSICAICLLLQVGRDFTPGVHNPLMGMILDRAKYQLGYPEAAKDMIASKNLLTAVEQYSMGSERPLSDYMKMVGLDMTTKELSVVHWCKDGMVSAFLIVSDFA
jgi:hypothetical protein